MKFQNAIKKQILRWRRAYILSSGIDFVAGILAIALGFVFVLSLMDALFYFQVRVRQALFILLIGFLAYETLKAVKKLFYHIELKNFSALLSDKEPGLSKYIGPAISFILMPEYNSKGVSKAFVNEHLVQTAAKIKNAKNIKFSPFDEKKFKSKLIGGISLALCLAAVWLINPLSAQRIVLPFSGADFENILTISPQNKTVLRAKSVLIKVSWEKKLGIVPVLQIKENGHGWVSVNWDKQKLFDCEYNIPRLTRDTRYRLKYRSMKSREYRLQVRNYPQIKDIKFTVKSPVYLKGGPGGSDKMGGDISYSYIPARIAVLEGSKISIKASADKRASKIVLRAKSASNDRKINFLKNKEDDFLMAMSVYEDMDIEFEIFADDGLSNLQKTIQKLSIVKDLPPAADILSPLFEVEMPSGGGIKIVYHAKDDFGLSQIKLRSEIRFNGKVSGKYNSLKDLKSFGRKNIREFIGETYVFFPNFAEDFEIYFYLRVFDNFPAGADNFRWTESLPVKVKIKNFYKNHIEALKNLADMKHNFAKMLEAEKKAAFDISMAGASFKTSDFLKRWQKFKKLSEKAFSSLNRDPYFNEGLKNEYETLNDDIGYMSETVARKAVQEFKGQYYKKAVDTQKSMASFLKRGLRKMDEILSNQTAKDFEFKAEDWENSLSKIDEALSQSREGKIDEKLWEDLSEIMKTLAMEMASMRKILSEQKYEESFGEKKRFQIPINKASSLADKLQKALKNRNLKEALNSAKALLEEIKKTRRVFGEYSDFMSSMQGGGEKIKKLQKIKELWNDLRDKEEEAFSKNTVFTDKLISKVNIKRKETLKQLIKLSSKINQTASTLGVKAVFIGKLSSTPEVGAVIGWRKSLKSNLEILEKDSLEEKSPKVQSLIKEVNFSFLLSSAIEHDERFYDLKDKTFFSDSADIQRSIVSDAYKLEKEISDIKKDFLKFSIKAQKHLLKAIDEMKAAVLALNAYDMDKTLAHQLKALEQLDALGDMINENMRKQKKMLSSKKRGVSGPKSFGAGSGGGPGGLNKSGVKLPKEGVYPSSKEIREKVMQSLKEKYPQKKKDTILDYLRDISE
ncbi:MAG: hypothetical protein KAR84_01950 [Elusimicrobiales bacterium]|nr:hypothetical protein [Elusimicrobiales bacterium]